MNISMLCSNEFVFGITTINYELQCAYDYGPYYIGLIVSDIA